MKNTKPRINPSKLALHHNLSPESISKQKETKGKVLNFCFMKKIYNYLHSQKSKISKVSTRNPKIKGYFFIHDLFFRLIRLWSLLSAKLQEILRKEVCWEEEMFSSFSGSRKITDVPQGNYTDINKLNKNINTPRRALQSPAFNFSVCKSETKRIRHKIWLCVPWVFWYVP